MYRRAPRPCRAPLIWCSSIRQHQVMSMGGRARPATAGGSAARSTLARAALQSLLLASVALFFLNFNVLGTASPSKRFSQDLVYAWFGDEAWLYPRASRGLSPPAAGGAPGLGRIICEPAR